VGCLTGNKPFDFGADPRITIEIQKFLAGFYHRVIWKANELEEDKGKLSWTGYLPHVEINGTSMKF